MATALSRDPRQPGLYLSLAPMDGVTDAVYRDVMTAMHGGDSGISQCTSEFVRVTDRAVPAKVLLKHCPELLHGGRTPAGVAVFVQILGGKPEPIVETALLAVELGAPGIDLNFGCPAQTVNRHDGGASLLRTPCRIEDIVAQVRSALPSAVPVSAKIRTGWDDSCAVAELARAAEAGGADWLTVHGRTREDGYAPPADWVAIGRARAAVKIPVLANGDLNSAAALARCAEASGCGAFMIGRGALGDPELFRHCRGQGAGVFDAAYLCALLDTYAERMLAAGAGERSALNRLKQWLAYGSRCNPALALPFEAIKRLPELAAARQRLSQASAASWRLPERSEGRPFLLQSA
jgi:tRNA-dihydrouridine synthase C